MTGGLERATARYVYGRIEIDEFERIIWAVLTLGAQVSVEAGEAVPITDAPGSVYELPRWLRHYVGPPTKLEDELERYERAQTLVRFNPRGGWSWA